ncbi:TPA: dUTP diphosphatase [candidate division WOR-3 bacterium]|jgi:dUTP pyrophosphatase|uniref:Deoxyuridine 5'-triphosphate nucleotidohydrolase n=1 Tax=candidate division WOR-3 bacterium TaxID=2052148 RepID=A0A350HB50_UNCW3|nr:dUTP diphosphatase [candidate division WOR-3 bacterium]
MKEINVKIFLEEGAEYPKYMTSGSSGADLFAYQEIEIEPKESALVRTGIKIEIEEGYECQIRPRSGYSMKNKILILNTPGTIDSDYRGEIQVIMYNLNDAPFTVKKGDRIAQIVFAETLRGEFRAVELKSSERGEGGFGHTGGM